MRAIKNLSFTGPQSIHCELFRAVQHLLQLIHRGCDVLGELQQVRDLLDSLPLARDEYEAAANRLCNTRRYLISEERGAARYELQVLAGILPRDTAFDVGYIASRTDQVSMNATDKS